MKTIRVTAQRNGSPQRLNSPSMEIVIQKIFCSTRLPYPECKVQEGAKQEK